MDILNSRHTLGNAGPEPMPAPLLTAHMAAQLAAGYRATIAHAEARLHALRRAPATSAPACGRLLRLIADAEAGLDRIGEDR